MKKNQKKFIVLRFAYLSVLEKKKKKRKSVTPPINLVELMQNYQSEL